jgi:hypothetical protein
MWRSVLLGVVLAGVLAGCSLGGGSGAAGGIKRSSPAENVRVPRPAPEYQPVPVLLTCPRAGFRQVIRSPLDVGLSSIYGAGGGMIFAVDQSERMRITC